MFFWYVLSIYIHCIAKFSAGVLREKDKQEKTEKAKEPMIFSGVKFTTVERTLKQTNKKTYRTISHEYHKPMKIYE